MFWSLDRALRGARRQVVRYTGGIKGVIRVASFGSSRVKAGESVRRTSEPLGSEGDDGSSGRDAP